MSDSYMQWWNGVHHQFRHFYRTCKIVDLVVLGDGNVYLFRCWDCVNWPAVAPTHHIPYTLPNHITYPTLHPYTSASSRRQPYTSLPHHIIYLHDSLAHYHSLHAISTHHRHLHATPIHNPTLHSTPTRSHILHIIYKLTKPQSKTTHFKIDRSLTGLEC